MPPCHIRIETRGRIGWITLNRPEALNALNTAMMGEVCAALDGFAAAREVACVVITGSERAFAAGADIKEAMDRTFPGTFMEDFLGFWERVAGFRKPLVAAVSGYALGGGCELALMCDILIASETARFGLPEGKIGVMPGAGGTQRLARWVGKAKAMDLCLTGRMMDAAEAERAGLVSRLVAPADLLPVAQEAAEAVAEKSQVAMMMTKESVNRAFETSLAEGLRFERRVFQALFATRDQKEGMAAFAARRPPIFEDR
ncbi:enoyl-CoA hydratase-related protein [Xanthobacter sp. AM11]|uniref:enoyl-CoA hydratase-related protein n=1 Tax=Xanthobacter sp. AM11 TaxID=3380643 RepID=UPI0039BF00F6